MPVAADLFRRAFVASRLNGVYRPFPPRTESSGQREQASVSPTTRTGPTLPPGNCAMQSTTRWLTAILRGPSSMNTGSDYYFDRTGWGLQGNGLKVEHAVVELVRHKQIARAIKTDARRSAHIFLTELSIRVIAFCGRAVRLTEHQDCGLTICEVSVLIRPELQYAIVTEL